MDIKIYGKPPISEISMGGLDDKGNVYGVNSQYLVKNGKPILPIMGEFHYSRYQDAEWENEILKMKAGGVDVLSTYVFWIHHEEKKGEWNFSGNRNIRKFLELCKKLDMKVWLRIGPWVHGECRNGGYPDWLVEEMHDNGFGFSIYGKPIHEARTNDELYMKYVRLFWERLSIETKGMMCKDGGSIIGIQLENEYCHAGGPRDKSKGFEHMRTLKELAIELGFETPYYTATGWGGAVSIDGETLPVLGGYVDAPWAEHTDEMPACENFLIKPFKDEESVSMDSISMDTYSKDNNPYLTAELGGGLQVTGHRRTYPFGIDIEAQSFCVLASGANLLGYYMYHGGVNPDGTNDNPYATYQETKATGYFNNLTIKGYDFEAPIHESGKLNDSYGKLKKLHLLANTLGESLAMAVCFMPSKLPKSPEDMETPRISVRYNHDTGEGFLFVNNHQRLRKMKEIRGLCVCVSFMDENEKVLRKVEIKDINCATDACIVVPFGLKMGEGRLMRTNAALLAKVADNYYFYYDDEYCDEKPYFEYEGDVSGCKVILLARKEAERAYIFGERLYISDRTLIEKNGDVYMFMGKRKEKVLFSECDGESAKKVIEAAMRYNDEKLPKGCRVYQIELNMEKVEGVNDIYLNIDFNGDRAQLLCGDRLLTDWFANGDDWSVALRRYGYPKKLQLVVCPYVDNVYYDLTPKKGCALVDVRAEDEYMVIHSPQA